MTSKRARRTRAKQRRRQIEAQHPIDDARTGPGALKSPQRWIPLTPMVERHGVWLNPHEAKYVDEHEAKLTKALRQGTSYGPGNLAVFDWGEPEDYCYGTVDEDGVERIYHRPDCPHQERP